MCVCVYLSLLTKGEALMLRPQFALTQSNLSYAEWSSKYPTSVREIFAITVHMLLCVCVCERERERERERVCVCVCERERERESVCVCVCV